MQQALTSDLEDALSALRSDDQAAIERSMGVLSSRFGQMHDNDDLFMLAPEPYLITDSAGAIRDANLAAAAFFGLQREALRHKPLQVFMVAEVPTHDFYKRLSAMIPSDLVSFEQEIKSYRDERRFAIFSGLKVIDEQRGERILWLIRDVSDQRAQREALRESRDKLEDRVRERTSELELVLRRLREANQAKDEFLALISHELRTPLTIVLGNVHMLRTAGNRIDEESQKVAMQDIEEEAQRLNRLIENLMILARLDARRRPAFEPVRLREVIQGVIGSSPALKSSGIETRIDVPANLPLVNAVPVYVEQIIQNLAGNVVKYSESELLDVRAELSGHEVVISVRDFGSGMTDEDRSRIFEPFFRGVAGQPRQSGAGIGLTVCQRLVEAQGGTIRAEAAEGGGTVFSFSLPVYREDATDPVQD